MWRSYYVVDSLDAALDLLDQHGAEARIIAGGTDLIIEFDRGSRKPCVLVDVTRIAGRAEITRDAHNNIHIGMLTTHNDVVASDVCRAGALPLVLACREVGAPQIRNRATVVGNVVTASPANDTITALVALNAHVVLHSKARGMRNVPVASFYTGVRKTVMQPDELVREIVFPALSPEHSGTYIKLGLRRAQAISVVNCAVVLRRNAAGSITDARLALGAVAPTIVRAATAEHALTGGPLTSARIAHAAHLARNAATPINDIRATARYRSDMVEVLAIRALNRLAGGAPMGEWNGETAALNACPFNAFDEVTLSRPRPHLLTAAQNTVAVRVNDVMRSTSDPEAQHKTLLRLLREDFGLTGTKEGCAEGECGACTVIMDARAVMACLVPAPRASGSNVLTIEGLVPEHDPNRLHPLQQAFIDHHAVQCGYCTPGFLMSGASLFGETRNPSDAQIKEAISGNLCRCTGYYKILEAFEATRAKLNRG